MLSKLKLLWKARALVQAVENERKRDMAFSWKTNLLKALQGLVLTGLAVVAAYFAVPDNLTPVLGFLPDTIEKALVPLLAGVFLSIANWLKNRNK